MASMRDFVRLLRKLREPKEEIAEVSFLISEEDYQRANLGEKLDEGRWTHLSGGLSARVEPQRPELRVKRHVHVGQTKHVNAPNKQYSWNDDGTRHDAHRFPSRPPTAKMQQAARDALGLPPDTILENFKWS